MMVNEVGALDYRPQTQICAPAAVGYPFFAPQIYHGYRRFKPLVTDAATIAITDLLSRTNGRTAHDAFRLDPETRIIGLGVAKDHELEKWWVSRDAVVEKLRMLQLDAVTVPNYSVFANAPRHQTLVSIARIHAFAEALSAAGIATIPHIYAETDTDWGRWGDILKEQPRVSMLAMEFQTGLRLKEKALPYLQRLAELQQILGRPLHLVAVGGTQYRKELWSVFGERFTLTDATPFMKTFRRIRAEGREGDERIKMQKEDDLADLLQSNIDAREKRLRKGMPVLAPVFAKLDTRLAA